jgi:two-component system, NtrC family, sensor histidine kinase HydH
MSTHAITNPAGLQTDNLARQQTVFCVITLVVCASLLLMHGLFALILGRPSPPVFELLGVLVGFKAVELIWLYRQRQRLTEKAAKIESAISIVAIFLLTALLAFFTNREETPYFVLLAIPILQCAYMFGPLLTLLTISAADAMILAWTWYFYALHPPARITEYLEVGMICVIYFLMGSLVWFLVNQLKAKQLRLESSLGLLHATRERLIMEEKLAAVGRLASGVAHEIRNPVAMISSSLATAAFPTISDGEREEMFAIAARESKRLENLTADFLTYARPTTLRRTTGLINDLLGYIAAAAKARAASRSVSIVSELADDLPFEFDAPQVEGAVLNLVMNAIDATPEGGKIKLNAAIDKDMLRIDVEDSGPAIPGSDLARVFEPFFTTKSAGTGLGLAIARAAAKAHGGDLLLSENRDGCVRFRMKLGKPASTEALGDAADG